MAEGKLTKRQKELLALIPQDLRRETALQFVKGGYKNQSQAYLAACEKLGKKPSKNPVTSASEILAYPNVSEFIDSFKEEAAKATQTDATYVLRRLREIDELDIIDILNDDLSAFKPLKEWTKAWRTSISGMDMKTIVENGDQPVEMLIQKIKFPDKVKNLELIGRHVSVKAWDKEVNENVDTIISKVQIEVFNANQTDSD